MLDGYSVSCLSLSRDAIALMVDSKLWICLTIIAWMGFPHPSPTASSFCQNCGAADTDYSVTG